MKNTKIISGVLACLLLASCAKKETTSTSPEVTCNEEFVAVRNDSPICSKIKLMEVTEEPFCSEFRTVGTVQAEAGRYAEVCTPFDGRVSRVSVRLGDNVKAGQTLFELASSDFVEAGKTYFQAVREYEKVQAEYQRKKTLMEHGIVAQRELDEAFAEAENARHEKESAEATLRVYNVSASSLKMGQSLRVEAPIAGEVVATHLTPGQFAKADDEALVTIADLSSVWVTAQIKERYLGSVTMGGKAEVFMDAAPNEVISANVLHIGNMVDEETRSVQVILGCENADRRLKHGQFVSVHFMSEPTSSIVLPATAIFQGEERSYVFVATDKENTYVRRQVEVGATNDDNQRVSIRSGLKAGERVIVEGGLYLND